MAGKHITLPQLEMTTRKLRDELQYIGFTVTLPAADWDGGAQTVEHEAFLADGGYWYLVCGNMDVDADDITVDGQATFQCREVPDNDLTVRVIRFKVETDGSGIGRVFNLICNEDLKEYIDLRFSEFYQGFLNERPIDFSLLDSDRGAIQDNEGRNLAGQVIFQVK